MAARLGVVVLVLGLMLCGGRSAGGEEVLAPLVALPIAEPNAVLGADDKTHLAYEFILVNGAAAAVTLKKVEALDAESGAVLAALDGAGLAQMVHLNGAAKGVDLLGGGSGTLFMDVALDKEATLPKALRHRFTIEVAKTGDGASDDDRDPAPEPPRDVSFTTDPLKVDTGAPVVVAPPLKGERWVIGGGCCTPVSYHRGATLPINGALRIAERYAIDFVQLNDKGMLYAGDMHKVQDYGFFGAEIYAAADGTVVEMENGLPEQIPGKLPEGATPEMAAGNHVVVDIGEGRFALYAHMQPGSVRVKTGDAVTTGQVLGLLGNSGNTDTPHLHFHIMDGPSPLNSNGLPFVFTNFTGQGRLTDEEPLFTGGTVTIDAASMTGPHQDQMPLLDQVVSFP
jgi:murein DD-endopeptidase MepM/ murein hydrolase activator NlpD